MNFNEFLIRSLRTWGGNLPKVHAGVGLSEEAGEVLGLVKKSEIYGRGMDVNKLKEELGDVMYYAAMICHEYELDMGEVLALNVEKLQERYPERFTKTWES